MRGRARVVGSSVLALVAGASVMACFDLFHSTSFENACAIDAAACEDGGAPVADSGSPDSGDASADFCAWEAGTAQQVATHACAWLGACAGAIAGNAFGPCLLRATLAYDCAANPARPVIGAAHEYWDCLSRVASCGDVEACVEPSGKRGVCSSTASGYAQCEASDPATFIACDAGAATGTLPAAVEDCAASGQACFSSGLTAACSGSPTACGTAGTSCDDAGGLHDCDADGGVLDFGVSCASFGAGQCMPGTSLSPAACLAHGPPSCTMSSVVSCDANGVASGCPSGVLEWVSCSAVPGLACNSGAPGRPWDVSRACYTGPCGADSCSANGTTLTSCARGATVTVDCALEGLAACTLVRYPGDPSPHAQCGAPDGGAL